MLIVKRERMGSSTPVPLLYTDDKAVAEKYATWYRASCVGSGDFYNVYIDNVKGDCESHAVVSATMQAQWEIV